MREARGGSPLGLAEQFELAVESPGRVVLPWEVREALGLEPGDLFSLQKNTVSLRLDSFRDFLADEWETVSAPSRRRYLEEFLRRPLTALEGDGAIEVPAGLLSFAAGDRLVLEAVSRGLSHELYLYKVEG